MKGAVIYFSGTGNTEFVGNLFKKEFKRNDIECVMIDTARKKNFNENEYDFFVFGAPAHAGKFPRIYTDWISKYINSGNGKGCIIFSTQAKKDTAVYDKFAIELEDKKLTVIIKASIIMPNNYFIVDLNKTSDEEVKKLKEAAEDEVIVLVDKFLMGEKAETDLHVIKKSDDKQYDLSEDWAVMNLSVDNDLCVRCGKCVKNCPTRNISLKDTITFASKCISCQGCLHCCPENAFMYRGKHFPQYKL